MGIYGPEQWREDDLTGAADQYALGVMTYALIAGRMPFDAATPAGIMHKHLYEMPTPPHTQHPAVPEAVTQVLERALAKSASQRFLTCKAFAQAFESAISGQTGKATSFFFCAGAAASCTVATAPLSIPPRAPRRSYNLLPGGTGQPWLSPRLWSCRGHDPWWVCCSSGRISEKMRIQALPPRLEQMWQFCSPLAKETHPQPVLF